MFLRIVFLFISVAFLLAIADTAKKHNDELNEKQTEPKDKEMEMLRKEMALLARQVMLQKFYNEQKLRSDGNSGIKQVRMRRMGLQNYYSDHHGGFALAAMHDHANNIRTIGLGEFSAVLNGVEFKTRHNDYRLYMPHRTSKEYHKTEKIPFPDVPPSVLTKSSVADQVSEMREYFKAWRDQDSSHRDYEKYFKSLLCYLEGSWTNSGSNVDESFDSDRHFLDAKTWQELQDRSMFADYSGSRSRLENLAVLPTTISGFINDTHPLYSQWNYRIVCHPMKKLLPVDRMRVVEDLSSRMMRSKNIHEHTYSRSARFQINTKDSSEFEEKAENNVFLDELMEEIPGKDNYAANLTDTGMDASEARISNLDGTVKNVGYYHRWYSLEEKDAFGVSKTKRGYSDETLFVAANTQAKVSGKKINACPKRRNYKPSECRMIQQKWSYAIPLEVIYLTPLTKWNPYNIAYHGEHGYPTQARHIVNKDGRNGNCKIPSKALNGTSSKAYFLTPSEFFMSGGTKGGTADTGSFDVCVADKSGVVRKVRASGTRVFLPSIPEIGTLRTRYPIMPVHGEGAAVWKELNALRDIVLDPEDYAKMFWNKTADVSENMRLVTGVSSSGKVSAHTHEVVLSRKEAEQLLGGKWITKTTSEEVGHAHTLIIRWHPTKEYFYYQKCTGHTRCRDGHPPRLVVAEEGMDAE